MNSLDYMDCEKKKISVCSVTWKSIRSECKRKSYLSQMQGYMLKMCDFCKNYSDNRIFGSNIPIQKCANETNLTNAQIMMNTGDKVTGIVIYSNYCMAKGYFDIAFCRCAAESWLKNDVL